MRSLTRSRPGPAPRAGGVGPGRFGVDPRSLRGSNAAEGAGAGKAKGAAKAKGGKEPLGPQEHQEGKPQEEDKEEKEQQAFQAEQGREELGQAGHLGNRGNQLQGQVRPERVPVQLQDQGALGDQRPPERHQRMGLESLSTGASTSISTELWLRKRKFHSPGNHSRGSPRVKFKRPYKSKRSARLPTREGLGGA